MNAITGTSSENTMPRSESWIRVWNTPAIRATTSPTTMPPTATTTRSVPAPTALNVPPSATSDETRSRTRAVASFTRLSPSRIVTMRRGTPSRRTIEVAATASGGETIAPKANAAAHGRSGTRYLSTAATITVVKITSPTERSRIGRRFALKSRIEVK